MDNLVIEFHVILLITLRLFGIIYEKNFINLKFLILGLLIEDAIIQLMRPKQYDYYYYFVAYWLFFS